MVRTLWIKGLAINVSTPIVGAHRLRLLFTLMCFSMFQIAKATDSEAFKFSPIINSEMNVTQRAIDAAVIETQQSRVERAVRAFEKANAEGLRNGFNVFMADLYLDRDLDNVNSKLLNIVTTDDFDIKERYRLNDEWGLNTNRQLYYMILMFGAEGKSNPGRLYPETEGAILELLWEKMKYKNDIHLSKLSTWWLIGSENHDIVAKVSSLITSSMFKNHPDFKDRVYPNLGKGGGENYWFHSMYGRAKTPSPSGRANYADGKQYTAAQHHAAWVDYFKRFLRDRIKRGFFLENASPNYMAVTLSYLTDLVDLSGDDELSKMAEDFMDIFWADWAQDQIDGVKGGAKTRTPDGNRWKDATYNMASFYFGGEATADALLFSQAFSSYSLKPFHWKMTFNRKNVNDFALIKRIPGEEEGKWPRPLGTERTMLVDTQARLLKYSWVTPDYVLGTQMDHPGAIHSHLSTQGRWQGIIFKGDNGPRVFPVDFKIDQVGNYATGTKNRVRPSGLMRSVQHKNVLIAQQARRFNQINPDWFPAKSMHNLQYGVWFGDNLDKIVEEKGWIFVQHGDAFLAVKIVIGEYAQGWQIIKDAASEGLNSEILEDSYQWTPDRRYAIAKDNYAGVIFEASTTRQHPNLRTFIDDILDNPITLTKTVVPGFHVLSYKSAKPNSVEIEMNLANSEIPFVNHKRINYAPKWMIKSPFIESQYDSGVVEINVDDTQLIYDFN